LVARILRSFTGARIRRIVDRSDAVVAEHAHDWPVLSIFVIGGYTNATEQDRVSICGPSAVLYRAGAAHQNDVGPSGFEQIEIEFDPDWLGRRWLASTPITRWIGGWAACASRELARACNVQTDEAVIRTAMRRFIDAGRHHAPRPPPSWVNWIDDRLRHDPNLKVSDFAQELGLHPSYLGTAYRLASGESAAQVAARVRIEHAAKLLRESDRTAATIAADAGFFDQSHMNRTFRRLLARTPSDVKGDREFMRASDLQTIASGRADALRSRL
jgi:AraC family transcriptional regulator